MIAQFPRIFLTLILCGACKEPALAQSTANLLDAPFTATLTFDKVGQATIKMRIARASNGSTYRGPYERDGKRGHVIIEDVPNHRRIEYPVPTPEFRDHTYRLTATNFFTESIEEHRLRGNKCVISDKDKVKAGRLYHYTSLGEKNEDGMILFGRRVEETFEDGTKRVSEYWDSDLGIQVSRTVDGPQPDSHESWAASDIRREEPDPSLFQVPKEYLSDPLLEVNTIFIDNQTGIPEVLDMATTQLNSWKWPPAHKPLTIVQDKSAADLTATFTKITDNELQASHQMIKRLNWTPASGIKMQIQLRGSSQIEFENAAGSSGTARGDGSAAQTCVSALWTLVSNARVGQWPPADASKPKDSLAVH